MSSSWKCPFCNQYATITEDNYSEDSFYFHMDNKYGHQCVELCAIVCPNEECKEYTLKASLYDQEHIASLGRFVNKQPSKAKWQLIPRSLAKVFPDYIPIPIRNDYEEACLIRDLSPKASATLARRCLQGMIRDFWGIKKSRLVDEIVGLEEKVSSEIWQAIDAVRNVGNIGAHMEKDINMIIDVEPNEAQLLLGLIEMLFEEWYVARHERQKRLQKVAELGKKKAPNG